MKAMYFIVATLIVLSLASCTANENDPVSEESSVNALVNTYGATNILNSSSQSDDLRLGELPGITPAEAYTILGDIRKHRASQKDSHVLAEQKDDKVSLKVVMSETVSAKYTFILQLNLIKYTDGSLYYSGYEADCRADSFKWYLKGFSFSCDNNQAGCYKFETQGYLYFKVIDDSVQYLKVPFKVKGTYNTATQSMDFTYNL